MRTEPMVLLKGDLTNWETSDLKDLTQSLMIALDENRADDFSIGISQFYGRLQHPDLSSQLRPYILDASKNVISRRTAKDQLYGDYMITLRAPVGIYLVGWFDKPKWDPKDPRRRQAPELAVPELQARLDGEAADIPQGYLVRPVVVDCHAP